MQRYFTSVLGNADTKARLFGMIKSKALPHALLISGPLGSGRRTLAKEIAAALNCENRDSEAHALPCGACNSCKRISEGNFPDVKHLVRTGGKASIGAQEIRDFREDMFLSATEAEQKIYIIEEAELMTSAAQNALLKVLEEPPPKVYIFLITVSAEMMLTTIRSRAQLIQMEIFDSEMLKTYVTELSAEARLLDKSDRDKLLSVLLSSGGVIGRALSRLDEKSVKETEERRKRITDFLAALPKKASFAKLYSATFAFPQKRDELKDILEELTSAIRDLIIIKTAKDISLSFFHSTEEAEEYSLSGGIKRLMNIYEIIQSACSDIDRNVLIQTLLTDLAVKVKGVE